MTTRQNPTISVDLTQRETDAQASGTEVPSPETPSEPPTNAHTPPLFGRSLLLCPMSLPLSPVYHFLYFHSRFPCCSRRSATAYWLDQGIWEMVGCLGGSGGVGRAVWLMGTISVLGCNVSSSSAFQVYLDSEALAILSSADVVGYRSLAQILERRSCFLVSRTLVSFVPGIRYRRLLTRS